MPRRKTSEINNPVYGVWVVSRDIPDGTWLNDLSGRIVQSDFLGLARAYVSVLEREGRTATVMIIGESGMPVELED